MKPKTRQNICVNLLNFCLFGFAFPIYAQPATANTYALVVGISNYNDEQIPDLSYAHRDAEAFANYLHSPAGGNLKADQVNLLTNDKATFGNITAGLDWLSDVVKEGDRILIYFAGHADVETKTVARRGFLLTHDSPATNYRANSLGLDMLADYLNTYTQKKVKVMLIADACHAGKLAGTQVKGSAATTTALIENFPNQVRIMSCQPQEYSLESKQWGEGRGVFSFYLINGLLGMADHNQDRKVSLLELQNYLQEVVPAQTAPQSQVPLVYGGNMQEQIAKVDPQILADLKKRPIDQTLTFAAVDNRGIEESMLTELDTSLVHFYRKFKKALTEHQLFEPKGNCANDFYHRLEQEPKVKDLLPIIQRQYVAALMEEVQRDVNRSLRDQEELGERGDVTFLPKVEYAQTCVNTVLQLLDEGHYLYKSLLARKHHYEALKFFYLDIDKNSTFIFRSIQEIEKAMALDSLIADVYNTAGVLYRSNNSSGTTSANIRASKFFAKAADLAPTWAIPQLNLLFFWRSQREYSKALAYAKQVMEIAPHRWFAAYHLGVETARKDPQTALSFYQKTVNFPDFRPQVYNSMALISRQLKDTLAEKKAQELYIQAIPAYLKMRPASFEIYCDALVKDILKNNPKADEVKELRLKLPQIKPIDIYFGLGVYYHFGQGRDAKKAEQYFHKVLEINPDHLWASYKLGQLYQFQIRDLNRAKRYFFKTLDIDSTHIFSPINLAGIYMNESKNDSVQLVLNQAIKIRPDFAMNYSQMAVFYLRIKDLRNAEYYYQKANLCNEQDITYLRRLAEFYLYTVVQPRKAKPYYEKIYALDSNLVAMAHDMMNIFRLQHNYTEERNWVEKIKKIDPWQYYIRLAWYFGELKTIDSINWALTESIKYKRNARNFLDIYEGTLNLKLNKLSEAKQIFKEMDTRTPSDFEGFWGLSTVYFKRDSFQKMEELALQRIPKAMDQNDSLITLCHLALAYHAQGRLDEYKKTLDLVLNLHPQNPWGVYNVACIHIYMGKIAEAMPYLEEACKKGLFIGNFWEDYDLEPVRSLPEFEVLTKKYYPGIFE